MPIMTKMVRTLAAIQVMGLMPGAVGCTVGETVVSDAARRVRVKPLSRPQTQQMPPRPRLSISTVQTACTHHMEVPVIGPQARWGEGRSPVLTRL